MKLSDTDSSPSFACWGQESITVAQIPPKKFEWFVSILTVVCFSRSGYRMKRCWKKQPKKWPYCIRNTGNAEKWGQIRMRACLNLNPGLTALNVDLYCCCYAYSSYPALPTWAELSPPAQRSSRHFPILTHLLFTLCHWWSWESWERPAPKGCPSFLPHTEGLGGGLALCRLTQD